jgi:phosphoglycolate phosphatase-like HAD superfamily hydrolase
MLRVLALDFDGVISNSAPEAFVVALRTYVAMKAETEFRDASARISGEAAPALDVVRGHELYRPFLDLMPLGNRAEDYAVILAAVEAGRELFDQAAYDAFREGIDVQWMREYHKRFYQVRAQLSSSDPEGWVRLMSPYEPFLDVLRRRAKEVVLAVATAKDRRSVRELLRAYGIDDLFPEDCVLDKETGVGKSAHLRHLQEKFECHSRDMTFVDDKVNHLDEVGRLGVRCALATWGFNGPREEALARAAGYLVCTLDDVEAQIFGQELRG